jgi:HK97 gp10 family phage protein
MPPLQAQLRVDSEFDLTDAVVAGAFAIRDRFRATCAVDTGEMQGSAEVLVAGRNHAVIYVSADHSSFVEYGTRKMAAQPALGPAVDEMLPQIFAELAAEEARQASERSGGGFFDFLFGGGDG